MFRRLTTNELRAAMNEHKVEQLDRDCRSGREEIDRLRAVVRKQAETIVELTATLKSVADHYGDGDEGLQRAMSDGLDAELVAIRAAIAAHSDTDDE